MLLGKLKAARKYTDIAVHGTMKLTAYFGVMSYCVVSRVEKLMVSFVHVYSCIGYTYANLVLKKCQCGTSGLKNSLYYIVNTNF